MESLIEQLPKIVAEGKKEVERIMERLESDNRITLQTNKYVPPVRKEINLFQGKYQNIDGQNWFNRLCYGDNLLVMQRYKVHYYNFMRNYHLWQIDYYL